MKTYNRKLKKWVEEDKPVGSLKRPETCKGKKPHDWVLLIPAMYSKHKPFSKEEVQSFYEIQDDRAKWEKSYSEKLEALGLQSHHWSFEFRRFYKCARCGKEKYE